MREEYSFVSPYDTQNKPFYINIAGMTFCDGSYRINRRDSKILCAEYILHGRGTVICGGERFNPTTGDVYLLMYGRDHLYFSDADDPWTKIWFNAGGPVVESLMRAYNLIDVQYIRRSGAFSYFERMVALTRGGGSPDTINAGAALIFHELLQYLSGLIPKTDAKIDPDALIIKNYIDAHISERIDLNLLSSLIFKSRSQTLRIFREQYGIPPYEYLLCRRIEQAKSLLIGTNMPIKEISRLVGFSDEHYFSNIFRQKVGVSPRQVRD